MQKIFFPKEVSFNENRVATTPDVVRKIINLGFQVYVEKEAGYLSGFKDELYSVSGAQILDSREEGLKLADIVVGVKRLPDSDINLLRSGTKHLSLLDVFNDKAAIEMFKNNGVQVVSFEMIPRISLAQKMDVLSSQSSLAGYSAVIQSFAHTNRVVPMMITAAGTISPIKVFIIGAGVAGLQAIATAKRLGASVEAFDTRPEVAEQVRSLGAKFLKIDLGKVEKNESGYASELTHEQIAKQKQGMISACKNADIVLTTAKVFGRKAPLLIDSEMLDCINTKTLFVDMATSVGGNVEGSTSNKIIQYSDYVKIWGMDEAEQYVAHDASNMFAENVFNFIEHFNTEDGLNLNQEDPILEKCIVK